MCYNGMGWAACVESTPDGRADGLRKKLEEWGKLTDIVIMKDKHTNRPRGFGFVTFEDAAVADKLALQKHVEVDGRMVVSGDSGVC